MPVPVRQVSGGVSPSLPGQNGQPGAVLPVSSATVALVYGRAARSAAMMTVRSRIGSWR